MPQIERLISCCNSEETKIFLHLDKRMTVTETDKQNLLNNGGGVYFTKNRLGGELDTKSLVEIVFLLIKRVKEIEKEEKIHFDYYLLLSG